MVNEIQHASEIAALEKRFELWETQTESNVMKPVTRLPTARDVVKDLPPEVASFEVCGIIIGSVAIGRVNWDKLITIITRG